MSLRFRTRLRGHGGVGPELVSNGTFDADIVPWTVKFDGAVSWSAGALRVTANGGAITPRAAYTLVDLTVGATYRAVASITAQSASLQTEIFATTASTGSIGGKVGGNASTAGVRTDTFDFVATAATLYLILNHNTTGSGSWSEFDNVSVKRIA